MKYSKKYGKIYKVIRGEFVMITKDLLLKDMIIHEQQGYALYCYHDGNIIEECKGKLKEEDSKNIEFDSNFRLASVSKQFIALVL